MTFPGDVRDVALRLCALLERERIPYALMGGIAVPIWGIPRATYDVDVTLSVDGETLGRFIGAAKTAGFAIDPPFEAGFRDRVSGMDKLTIEWWTEDSRRVEVDVFLVTTEYQTAAFPRRVRVRINGTEAWVLTAADLVLHKLLAGRPKDVADVDNILAVQGLPDATYLRSWSERLGVRSALEAAMQRARLSWS
jgi:hypothetical protein